MRIEWCVRWGMEGAKVYLCCGMSNCDRLAEGQPTCAGKRGRGEVQDPPAY
jgi:hypothetical protein